MPFVTAALTAAGIAASVGTGIMQSNAVSNAAQTQADAATQAAELQKQLGEENLNFQQQIYNQQEQNQLPFIEAGQNSVTSLNRLTGQAPLSAAPAASQKPVSVPGIGGADSTYYGTILPYMQGRARGGPVGTGHYLVGEKGPEVLDINPGSSGMVTPIKRNRLTPKVIEGQLVHRYMGGPVENPGIRPVFQTNPGNPVQTRTPAATGTHGPPTNLTQEPAVPLGATAANPYGVQGNNPLITGGSKQPIQNTPFTQWSQPFVAPTLQQAEQYPGYQFQLQQGENAILNNASALGTTGSPTTAVALDQYAQGLAQSDYNNIYNQAMQQYLNNYNIFNQNQTGQFNRLASIAGLGQTATGQLNNSASQVGSNVGNTLLTTGQNIGQQMNNAAAAQASGYIGSANAWGGALNGISNAATLPLYLQMMNQNQPAAQLPAYEDYSWMPSNPVAGQAYYPES